jgi:hypothetical protein
MKDWIMRQGSQIRKSPYMAALVVPLLILFAAPVAQAASGTQFCTGIGSGSCLNMWNGGPSVKSYGPNVANNDLQQVTDVWRCNGGYTTSSCPIAGNPANLLIVNFVDHNPNSPYYRDCIGDANDSSSNASVGVVDPCDNGGANGGWGTVYVQYGQGCPNGAQAYYNAHWSSSWSSRAGLGWSGSGQQAYNNTYPLTCGYGTSFSY